MLDSLKSLKSELIQTLQLQKKVFHDLSETVGALDLEIAERLKDYPEVYIIHLLSAASCYFDAKNLEMVQEIIKMVPPTSSKETLAMLTKFSDILSQELK